MSNNLLMAYLKDVQSDTKTPSKRFKYAEKIIDKSIAMVFAVSILALLLKISGEALVETWIK